MPRENDPAKMAEDDKNGTSLETTHAPPKTDPRTHDFRDIFEPLTDRDSKRAVDQFFELLNNPAAFNKRIATLEVLIKHARSGNDFWGHVTGTDQADREYVRELWWLAQGSLPQAIDSGKASPERLARLASNPAALKMAFQVLLEGETAIEETIRQCRSETWNWIRDEIAKGHFRPFAGRHIAMCQRDGQYVVDDSPVTAAARATAEWDVPPSLIAVTFVDRC